MDDRFDPELQPSLDEQFTVGRFKDKVVVVTGGASGIGFAVVYRFVNDGAKVAIVDINSRGGKAAEEYFDSKGVGSRVKFYECDVSNKENCQQCINDWAGKNEGIIDFLINGAAYFGSKGLQSKKEDWDQTMSVNVIGCSNMVQACHKYMKRTEGQSAIVNVSSISAYHSQPIRWTYSASKAAIIQMSKCMALDLAKDNIRVNSTTPSWIWTPEVAKIAENGKIEDVTELITKFHLIPRVCQTSEVASVITFLCSRDASYITGSNFPVDGGYSSMGPEAKGESSKFAGQSYDG